MGIASFVVGISCLILSPFLSIFLILPSILGLVLGIIDTIIKTKNNQSKGLSIAGIVLSSVALAICIIFTIGTYIYSNDYIANNSSGEITPADVSCNLGETVTLGNLKVTFKNADLNYKDYEDYAYIDKGNTVLKADFEFENTGSSNININYYDFECFADKFSYNFFYYIQDYDFVKTLKPGEKCTESVYFEVPKNSKTIDIEYNNYSYDNIRKIIFHVKDLKEKNV